MLTEPIRTFVAETRRGVLTTFRRSGAAQMSIVTCGPYRDGVAFTTTADRAKLLNLKRDARCSILVSQEDWRGYVVFEGRAQVLSSDNTDAVGTARRLERRLPRRGGRRTLQLGRIRPGNAERQKVRNNRAAGTNLRHPGLKREAAGDSKIKLCPERVLSR